MLLLIIVVVRLAKLLIGPDHESLQLMKQEATVVPLKLIITEEDNFIHHSCSIIQSCPVIQISFFRIFSRLKCYYLIDKSIINPVIN